MPILNDIPTFLYGLQTNYDKITDKNLNALYFTTDTQRLYLGEMELTRPVQHGTSLPTSFLPPNSLFYHETEKNLYFSKDGTEWVNCANFYSHPTFTAKVVGENESSTLDFGSTFKIPKLTVNDEGHVSSAEDITITLPSAPSDIKNTFTLSGSGNAITSITDTGDGHSFTVVKGESFATSTELSATNEEVAKMMPKTGGTFTGAISVPTPTEDSHATTKKFVTDSINSAIGTITSFSIDSNGDEGYDSLSDLETAYPTGSLGVFYLVKSSTEGTGNIFEEYFWTGSSYEMAGKFGDVDTSSLATKSELDNKVDKTITVNGQALSSNVTITDISGNAGTATKLATAIKINGVSFDGSQDITITADAMTHTHTISDISDFNISNATANQILSYDSTNKKWVNTTLSLNKTSVGLNNVDNTADANKSVLSATKLTTARTISLTGDASGSVSFDGSSDKSMSVTVNNAAKATKDGNGNVIADTYATKTEVENITIRWGTF